MFLDNRVVGCHIIAPVPAPLWAGSHSGIRRFRAAGYEPSLRLATACGLTHVGLGALLPFATQFGRYGDRPPGVRLTTGHAATVANIGHMAAAMAEGFGIDWTTLDYTVFGAAGSIGSNVARWFARSGVRRVRLVDVRERAAQARAVAAEVSAAGAAVSVYAAEDLSDLPMFDVGVIATNRAGPWVDAGLLRKAPVWLDDSHPRAVSPAVEAELSGEVLYLECYVRGSRGLSQTFPFRLPTPRDCYSCFAEVFVCWREGMGDDFVVGEPTLDQIALMDRLLPRHGFRPGPLTGKGGDEIPPAVAHAVGRRLNARG